LSEADLELGTRRTMMRLMPEPVLWEREPHTRAKHLVLRSYVDAWFPVMAYAELDAHRRQLKFGMPRLLMVDGFAGLGRYVGDEPGSPLIMLDALRSHKAFDRFGNVSFIFLFIEYDARRVKHLEEQVAALGQLPPNVHVHIEHGAFQTVFGRVIDEISPGRVLVPTFAFIDPFGYSYSPMSLTGRLLGFPRAEALVFLPLSYVARFVGRSGQDAAMMALFGTERWREAIPLKGLERREFLLGLFEEQLRAQSSIQYVRSFQLRTQDGNDYRLVFATGNKKGLALIKTAMWRVDPVGGTSYVATTESGQEVLFTPDASVDTSPLLRELRRRFGTEPFTIGEAEDFTLFDTPFRHDGHLKRLTLAPAERARQLEPVDPKSGRKPRSYPPGTRMRFTS
jgi:three-Cys-motif partner protein